LDQAGGCAICAKKPRRRFLAVDHDHTSGAVRGLLCYYCNTAIGVFEFDLGTAERAIAYLTEIASAMRARMVEPGAPSREDV
jgi:hypothetical protein